MHAAGSDDYIIYPDLRNVDKMTFNFELGTPFKPYEQLMGVLPVASMEHIPLAYRVTFRYKSIAASFAQHSCFARI